LRCLLLLGPIRDFGYGRFGFGSDPVWQWDNVALRHVCFFGCHLPAEIYVDLLGGKPMYLREPRAQLGIGIGFRIALGDRRKQGPCRHHVVSRPDPMRIVGIDEAGAGLNAFRASCRSVVSANGCRGALIQRSPDEGEFLLHRQNVGAGQAGLCLRIHGRTDIPLLRLSTRVAVEGEIRGLQGLLIILCRHGMNGKAEEEGNGGALKPEGMTHRIEKGAATVFHDYTLAEYERMVVT